MNAWHLPADQMPPLHQQVLLELKEGPGQVCDVACYIGKQAVEGGKAEDRWILADVRLDTRQIKRWAAIYPEPSRSEVETAFRAGWQARDVGHLDSYTTDELSLHWESHDFEAWKKETGR